MFQIDEYSIVIEHIWLGEIVRQGLFNSDLSLLISPQILFNFKVTNIETMEHYFTWAGDIIYADDAIKIKLLLMKKVLWK